MNNFNNMIQVLTYFADQCDMFKPILDGVKELDKKNRILDDKIKETNILYDRMQLNATYLADNANFGVEMIKSPNGEVVVNNIDPKNIGFEDRYNLIKAVISVGKDNYDREKMEQLLDFYSMINILDFDKYIELLDIIEEQHKVVVEELPVSELLPTSPESDATVEKTEDTETKTEEELNK